MSNGSLYDACYVWEIFSVSSKNRTRKSIPCTLYYYNKTNIHIDLLIYSSRNLNSAMSHALLLSMYSL